MALKGKQAHKPRHTLFFTFQKTIRAPATNRRKRLILSHHGNKFLICAPNLSVFKRLSFHWGVRRALPTEDKKHTLRCIFEKVKTQDCRSREDYTPYLLDYMCHLIPEVIWGCTIQPIFQTVCPFFSVFRFYTNEAWNCFPITNTTEGLKAFSSIFYPSEKMNCCLAFMTPENRMIKWIKTCFIRWVLAAVTTKVI